MRIMFLNRNDEMRAERGEGAQFLWSCLTHTLEKERCSRDSHQVAHPYFSPTQPIPKYFVGKMEDFVSGNI
jgi:hypothetical protein